MRGRPTKNLRHRVLERNFVPSRHGELLASDDSVLALTFEDDDPRLRYYLPLADLIYWYRNEAKTERDRAECARAFRDAIDSDYRRYGELLSETAGDGRVRWVEDETGTLRLVPCDCENCAAGKDECARGMRADMRPPFMAPGGDVNRGDPSASPNGRRR